MKENQNIEWKKSWRDEYIKWICGFANAAGGTLVIGKNDKGVVTGADNAGRLLEDIPNKVRDILGIIVDVNLKTDKGKDFLEIMVEPHPHPVSYKGQYHPLVASAFFRAGYIEAWGRGIEKINNECKMAGVPAPEINYEFGGLMITFQARSGGTPGETTQKTTQKILSILKQNPSASRKEKILERIGPAKGGHWKILKE